ncbi:MAG: hypothetical protein PHN92_09615 [Geobacter sp.]|nr:hypothetical protein [Geobacter sp.]
MKAIAAKEHKERKTASGKMLMFEVAKMVLRLIFLPVAALPFYSLRSFAANFGLYI